MKMSVCVKWRIKKEKEEIKNRKKEREKREWSRRKCKEFPATDVQAQFSVCVWDFTRIAFGQSAARAHEGAQRAATLRKKEEK